MAAGKRMIEKITARVFACPGVSGGGNPVTIFVNRQEKGLLPDTLVGLAKSCKWESVVAHLSPLSNQPILSFFMPSGEQVSFCAHAAMGAVWAVYASSSQSVSSREYQTAMNAGVVESAMINHDKNEVGLHMDTEWIEEAVNDMETLNEMLQNQLCWDAKQENSTSRPTKVNSSVARPKTLIHVNSVQELHSIAPPSNPTTFRDSCDAIESTGLYLYANRNKNDWECRQFPRASGYPEDPATGIAAAALAVSLHKRSTNIEQQMRTHNMYQGTAMKRPSLIRITNIQLSADNRVQLDCFGRIEVDDREEIQVDT